MSAVPAPSAAMRAIVLGALRHPDAHWRGRFREQVDAWAGTSRRALGAKSLEATLRAARGTALEPFTLTDEDVWLAVRLARLAMSKTGGQLRFRIVSRDTIGATGGLVVTSNGKAFYAERYALGRNRTPGGHFWHIAPALQPEPPAASPVIKVPWVIDDQGLSLRLPDLFAPSTLVSSERLTPFPTCGLRARTHEPQGGAAGPWDDVPFRACVRPEGLFISPANAEATLRLSAMAHGSFLEISRSEAASVLIRLAPPDDGLELDALVSLPNDWGASWIQAAVPPAAPPSLDAQLAIARWIGPPTDWLSPNLLGATE